MTLNKLNSKLILFLSLLLLFMFPIASAIVSHPASQVEPGAFQAGNYTFDGSIGIGTTTPEESLSIVAVRNGDGIFIDKYISSGGINIYMAATKGVPARVLSRVGEHVYVGDIDASNGSVYFRANGTNYVMINGTTGYVGIGTTTPTQTLHVQGNLNITGTSYLGNIVLTADEITTNSVKSKDGNITFKDSSSNEVMRITSDGKVGIGTTTPFYYLDIDKNVSGDVVSRVRNTNSTGRGMLTVGGDVSAIRFISYGTTHAFANLTEIYATGTSEMRIHNAANSPMTFYVNSAENMRITSGGNIGIGTTTPSAALEVRRSSGDAQIKLTSTGASTIHVGSANLPGVLNLTRWDSDILVDEELGAINFNGESDDGLGASIVAAAAGGWNADSETNLLFKTTQNGQTSPTERMRITSDGKVGIGTTTPNTKLEVRNDAVGVTYPLTVLNVGTNNGDGAGIFLTSTYTGNYGWKIRTENTASNPNYLDPKLVFSLSNAGSGDGDKVTITNAGNVGIGTTSPQDDLHINKSGNVYMVMSNDVTGATGTDGLVLGVAATTGNVNLWNYEATNMTFATNNVARMTLTSSGTLDIGTTGTHNNAYTLEVFPRPGIAQAYARVHSPTSHAIITTNTSSNSPGIVSGLAMQAGAYEYDIFMDASSGTVVFQNKTNNNVAILQDGRVGIGTDSPQADTDLTILPKKTFGLALMESDNGNKAVSINSGTTSGALDIYENGVAEIEFYTSGRSYIDTGANFGVGTKDPQAMLHVMGQFPLRLTRNVTGTIYGIDTEIDATRFIIHGTGGSPASNILVLNHQTGTVGIGTTTPAGKFGVTDGTNGQIYYAFDSSRNYIESANNAASAVRDLWITGNSDTPTNWTLIKANNTYTTGKLWVEQNMSLGPSSSGQSVGYNSTLQARQSSGVADGGNSVPGNNLELRAGIGTGSAVNGNIFFVTESSTGVIGNGIPHGVGSPKMTVLSTGNVGIGTTTPQTTLQTNGNFRVAYSPEPTIYHLTIQPVARAGYIDWEFQTNDSAGGLTTPMKLHQGSVDIYGNLNVSSNIYAPNLKTSGGDDCLDGDGIIYNATLKKIVCAG